MNVNKSDSNYQNYRSWFDWWLSDEVPSGAESEQLRQAHAQHLAVQPVVEPIAKKVAKPQNLAITLAVTNKYLPKLQFSKTTDTAQAVWPKVPLKTLAASVLVIAILMISLSIVKHPTSPTSKTEKQQAQTALAGTGSTPQSAVLGSSTAPFTPVAPIGKSELAKYVSGKTEYDAQHQIYTYNDTFQGAKLSVSEHALTPQYKTTEEAVTQLATKLEATDKFDLISGSAYMKTDKVSGKQNILLSVNGLLLYVDSPISHSVADWQVYLNSLQ